MGPEDFDKDKLIQAARDLRAHVDQTFAVFLDAERGWVAHANQLLALKDDAVKNKGHTEAQAYEIGLSYTHKRRDGSQLLFHRSTLAQTLSRVRPKGTNHAFLANMCAASIYAFWDAQGRAQLADAFFGKYDMVNSDLFGDLRLIRHCILHCRGIADAAVEKRCKMLPWFKEGDRIEFDAYRLHTVVDTIRRFTEALEQVANDPTPGVKAGDVFYGSMDASGKYTDLPPEGTPMGSPLKDPSSPKVPPKIDPEESVND